MVTDGGGAVHHPHARPAAEWAKILHRVFPQAGVDAWPVVLEELPHASWNNVNLPETKETYGYMAGFFKRELGW